MSQLKTLSNALGSEKLWALDELLPLRCFFKDVGGVRQPVPLPCGPGRKSGGRPPSPSSCKASKTSSSSPAFANPLGWQIQFSSSFFISFFFFFASRLPCAFCGYKQINFFFFGCKKQPGFSEPRRAAARSLPLGCADLTKNEIWAAKGCAVRIPYSGAGLHTVIRCILSVPAKGDTRGKGEHSI